MQFTRRRSTPPQQPYSRSQTPTAAVYDIEGAGKRRSECESRPDAFQCWVSTCNTSVRPPRHCSRSLLVCWAGNPSVPLGPFVTVRTRSDRLSFTAPRLPSKQQQQQRKQKNNITTYKIAILPAKHTHHAGTHTQTHTHAHIHKLT